MKKYIDNEKGLTLVEILAALVILGIILISFSSFFLQSAKNTKYNEEKLNAVAVAEKVIAEIRPNNHPANMGEYTLTNGVYVNSTTYDPFQVEIKVIDNEVINLNLAIITVKSNLMTGIKKTPFTTQMYFNK